MKISLSLVLGVVLLAGSLYEIFRSPVLKERTSQKRFEGQVSGFFAGLSLSESIPGCSADEICSFALEELRRCQKIKTPPSPQDDPFWYASHRDFGEFAFLCMERYAKNHENRKLLDYCKKYKITARKLTAYSGRW